MIEREFWRFETANIIIRAGVCAEIDDPADHFEFEEDIEAVRNDEVDWFCAVVEATNTNSNRLAWDTLGGCAYETAREFFEAHRDRDPMNRNCTAYRAVRGQNATLCHYFPDMVRTVLLEARETLRGHGSIKLRAGS